MNKKLLLSAFVLTIPLSSCSYLVPPMRDLHNNPTISHQDKQTKIDPILNKFLLNVFSDQKTVDDYVSAQSSVNDEFIKSLKIYSNQYNGYVIIQKMYQKEIEKVDTIKSTSPDLRIAQIQVLRFLRKNFLTYLINYNRLSFIGFLHNSDKFNAKVPGFEWNEMNFLDTYKKQGYDIIYQPKTNQLKAYEKIGIYHFFKFADNSIIMFKDVDKDVFIIPMAYLIKDKDKNNVDVDLKEFHDYMFNATPEKIDEWNKKYGVTISYALRAVN
ncbi:hypothetical protein [Mycoplasma sp. E35C]|uniref:hypothetical protein n=1 Tax=Mycoplasma sp. E35C TaxID=2801918 RepID=UPI001CA4575F|nr:hypothetical protein [Mycoplasma sp. E35C]QZX48976.1 hypothetical protein JJE79_02880 [Mycoplasma sp. E35C]